ncbi:hypothetical protein GBA52_017019 [Prunus armeniaca]|nr:hypothetical protein GBA52_017019 [Prunus armeniaca]
MFHDHAHNIIYSIDLYLFFPSVRSRQFEINAWITPHLKPATRIRVLHNHLTAKFQVSLSVRNHLELLSLRLFSGPLAVSNDEAKLQLYPPAVPFGRLIQTSKATAFWNIRKSCETSHFVNCRRRVEAPPAALMRGKKQDRRNFNGEAGRKGQCMAHAARKLPTNSQGPPSLHYAWGAS